MKNLIAALALIALAPSVQAAKLVSKDGPTSPITSKIEALHQEYTPYFDVGYDFAWTHSFDIESKKPSEKWSATVKQAVFKALTRFDDYALAEVVKVNKPFYLSSRLKRAKLRSIIEHGFNLKYVQEGIRFVGEPMQENFEKADAMIDAATDQLRDLALEDNRILVVTGHETGSFQESKFVALIDMDAGEIHLFGLGQGE